MTNEEAKRQLESAYPYLSNEIKLALDKVIDALGDCYIIPKNSTWIIDGIDVQEAIEKQKPKKPIIEGPYGDYCGTFYSCPICKEDFGGYFPFNMDEDLELPDYCPSCGQRLEWE